MYFANKCIVIGCFVGGTITKFSLRRESSWTISESRKMGSDLVLTECYCRQILRFTISPIDLIHFERVSSSTFAFLNHDLADASHVPMIISKLWGHENATGFLNFWPLRKRYLMFTFCTILRSPVTTWSHGAYRNSEPGQIQGRVFLEGLWKSICCRLLL